MFRSLFIVCVCVCVPQLLQIENISMGTDAKFIRKKKINRSNSVIQYNIYYHFFNCPHQVPIENLNKLFIAGTHSLDLIKEFKWFSILFSNKCGKHSMNEWMKLLHCSCIVCKRVYYGKIEMKFENTRACICVTFSDNIYLYLSHIHGQWPPPRIQIRHVKMTQ